MTKSLILLLAAGLALMGVTAVAADETDPNCEPDQQDPSTQSDRVSDNTAILRANQGSGACEGEHWDGRDGTGSTDCGDVGIIYLNPNDRIDRVGAYYNSCPDPEKPDLAKGPTDLVHLRVIGQGSPGWKEGDYNVHTGSLQAMVEIWGVGATGVFLEGEQHILMCVANTEGPCSPDTSRGIGAATVAWYGEDHTDQTTSFLGVDDTFDGAYVAVHEGIHGDHHSGGPGGNVLAAAVHFAHITMGQDVGEEDQDCTQVEYQSGGCKRDNTAITVELLA